MLCLYSNGSRHVEESVDFYVGQLVCIFYVCYGLALSVFYLVFTFTCLLVGCATSLSTYDFSTLYTTLPHNLIKEKLINLIEWTFKRECSPYIACNERQAFFTSEDTKRYKLWSCQNVCEALIYLLDNIYIRFGTKLYNKLLVFRWVLIVLPL